MMAHWREKEHGQDTIYTEKDFLYNEIWDGDRFSEFSWFWNALDRFSESSWFWNALGPSLQPLVREVKDGFIDGYEVEHKGGLQGFEPEKVLIRHLVLCWTGDYPGLCQVGKFLNGGVSP